MYHKFLKYCETISMFQTSNLCKQKRNAGRQNGVRRHGNRKDIYEEGAVRKIDYCVRRYIISCGKDAALQ